MHTKLIWALAGGLLLSACGEDDDAQFEVGVAFASRQVQGLIDAGVPGLHFYVLNKSQATASVLHTVGISGRA